MFRRTTSFYHCCLVMAALLSAPATSTAQGQKPAQTTKSNQTAKSKTQGSDAFPPEVQAALTAQGLKVSDGNLVLAGDADFGKMSDEAGRLKTSLSSGERDLRAEERKLVKLKKQIMQLKVEHIRLNSQLKDVFTVADNNRIVGSLNAIAGQVDLLLDQESKSNDDLKAARGKLSERRDKLIGQILEMATCANRLHTQRSQFADNAEAQAAVKLLKQATGKEFELKPSTAFVSAERKLKALEASMVSESIPITNENDSLYVSVVINGKHTRQMVVDSGATTLALPHALAKEMGIEPSTKDQKGEVELADGRTVPAWFITIASVRVGKFTQKDVECVVLDPSAANATPLLGMAFLGKYKFEIDSRKSVLKLLRFDAAEARAEESVSKQTKESASIPQAKDDETVRKAVPDLPIPEELTTATAYATRASQRHKLKDFEGASSDFDAAARLEPGSIYLACCGALARHSVGADEYRQACHEMFDRFGQKPTATTASWLISAALPGNGLDSQELIRLAKITESPWVLAGALCRAGRYQAALDAYPPDLDRFVLRPHDALYLAIARHGAGLPDEARASLLKARNWITKADAQPEAPSKIDAWSSWVERCGTSILLAEVEKLLAEKTGGKR